MLESLASILLPKNSLSMPQKASVVLLATSAALFGMSFTWALLFSSHYLFPFYQDFFNRGHFFYFLPLLIWLIFVSQKVFYFLPLPKFFVFLNKGRGALFVFLLNFIFFLIFARNGEFSYLYASPIGFSMQVLIFYILLGSRIIILRHNKVFLILGVLIAWYLFPFYQSFMPAFLLAFLVFVLLFISLFYFHKEERYEEVFLFQYPIFLYGISFLHYLFLMMLFASVWQQMDYFYYVIAILLTGFAVKKIILIKKIQLAKRYFGLYLGYVFLASLLFVFILPFYLWTAFLYTVLSLWLSLFFPKVLEKNEIDLWLVGEVIVLALLLQFFSFKWIEVFLLLVVVVAQIFFAVFFLKRFRYAAVFVFLIVISAWSYTMSKEFVKAKETSLFRKKELSSYSPFVLSWLWQFSKDNTIVSNAVSPKVASSIKNYSIEYRPFYSFFFSFYLRNFASPPLVFFIDLQRLGAYQNKDQIEALLKHLAKNKKLHGLFFSYSHEDIVLYQIKNSKITLLPTMSAHWQPNERQKESLYEVAMLLGDYFEQSSLFNDALLIYRQVLPWFEDDVSLYYRLSRTCGSMGTIDLQLYYLEKYLTLKKGFALAQEQQMMELLFLKGKYKQSLQRAEKLIMHDPQNTLDYFQWVFRIAKKSDNRKDWHRIYKRVLNYPAKKNSDEERKKLSLVHTIEKFLLQHPQVVEVIKQERIRQENLEIPDG